MAMRGLIAAIVASAALVAMFMAMQAPGREGRAQEEPETTAPASASVPASLRRRLGVRGADIDAARRQPGSAGARGFLATRPDSAEAPVVDPGPPPPPAPPVPPSEAAIAEGEAIVAARPQVLAAVEGALASGRADVRRACWTGDVPTSARFPVEASYSAEGIMLALSVGDDGSAPGVGACVRSQATLVPSTIEPPGVSVTVQAALTLP